MHKINKTAVAFLRRYATLFIKKTQYLLSRLRMNSLWRRTILNGLRLRSGHVQRKNNFKFRGSETPAGVSEPHFHEEGS